MTEKQLNESPTLCIPERSLQEWGSALLLFAFSVLILWPFRDFTVLFADNVTTIFERATPPPMPSAALSAGSAH
jgi:hypothetical protein